MPEETKEKAVCEKCGADVREGTTFCYSCGGQIASAAHPVEAPKPVPALDTPAGGNETIGKDSDKRLSEAAEQRRKARVIQRRSNEFSWEPVEDSRLTLLIAVLITVVALGIAFMAVHFK